MLYKIWIQILIAQTSNKNSVAMFSSSLHTLFFIVKSQLSAIYNYLGVNSYTLVYSHFQESFIYAVYGYLYLSKLFIVGTFFSVLSYSTKSILKSKKLAFHKIITIYILVPLRASWWGNDVRFDVNDVIPKYVSLLNTVSPNENISLFAFIASLD